LERISNEKDVQKVMKMMSKEKATKIVNQCLNEMYKKSKPSITWKKVVKKYSGTKEECYLKHTLTEKQYNTIKAKYYKNIPELYKFSFDMELLNYSPRIRGDKNG
jgi:hypothetical protein